MNKIFNVLYKLGIPLELNGFEYLMDALTVYNENIGITMKALYNIVAERHSVKSETVRANIVNILKVTCASKKNNLFIRMFGETDVLTNKKFIATVAKYVKYSGDRE